MLSISAIRYPSWGDLRHSVAQQLSGSLDCKTAKTEGSQTIHFLKFVGIYKLKDTFPTNDRDVTDTSMDWYVSSLLDGYTLQNISIAIDMISGYTRAVNTYYRKGRFNLQSDKKSETDAAKLLSKQDKFEEQDTSLDSEGRFGFGWP